MMLKLRMALLTTLGLFAASIPLPSYCQQGQGGELPEWQPDEARVQQLADETRFEGWAIRPPRDYQHRVTPDANEKRYLWAKQGEGALVVIEANVPAGQVTPEKALEAYLNMLKSRARNLNQSPFERGLVNGKVFLRTRFSAEGLPGVPGSGFGFVYQTMEGNKPMVITGSGTRATIENIEAAALTIRITP
ncbi:hypothetical protein BH23PLA1_BH23PLA1_19570 [soil metagenome]